ncbi:MAG: hypothetical protein Q4F84_05635 [Fibrobacter sp.]|nr:hypothetical protein [Fibrobacter sp.]
MKKTIVCFSILFVLSSICHSFERFTNYSTPRTVSDIKVIGDIVFVASSGGLYTYDIKKQNGKLMESNSFSPDPFLKAVVYDRAGRVWTGSRDGYLTVYDKGVTKSITSYFSVGWSINCMYPFGRYLIIGSNKGLSLFDTEKMVTYKSATSFRSFLSSSINTCTIFNDTLYLGMDEGIAKLSVNGVLNGNFYDPLIWETDVSVEKPVKSFLVSDKIISSNTFSNYFRGNVLKADKANLLIGTKKVNLASEITAIQTSGNLCWIGTEYDFFYSWDGDSLIQYKIPGMSSDIVNRIALDKTGKLWVLPKVRGSDDNKWWCAINSYDGNEWNYYNKSTVPKFGSMGDGAEHGGLFVDSKNRVWVGFYGGQMKCFDQANDNWASYVMDYKTNKFFKSSNNGGWGKIDAFVEDKYGFIWIGLWAQLSYLDYGSLICYDPQSKPDTSKAEGKEAHYRRFFPNGESYYSQNYTHLSLDSSGYIIAGGSDGTIIVFSHDGDPLTNGVKVHDKFTNNGMVLDIESMPTILVERATTDTVPSTITKIVTVNGVFNYDSQDGTFEGDTSAYDNTVAIVVEDENIYWSAVNGTGIVRYDRTDGDKKIFGRNHGLISDQITDMKIDGDKGLLWVGTEAGLSKLTLGYSQKKETRTDVVVYPNVYSKQKNSGKRIHFENLDPLSKVAIYSIDGAFIAMAKVGTITNGGAYYYWIPSTRIVPGTYIYSIHTENTKKNGKIIITP